MALAMRKLKEDLRWRAPDYSTLSERDFTRALADVDLAELEGIGNRRKWLQSTELTKWNDWQRSAILRRKYELEKSRGSR
tara:strand:+ start:475 stop:714 length:240 start_codon:yes stop_codon:yes gene_type:complete